MSNELTKAMQNAQVSVPVRPDEKLIASLKTQLELVLPKHLSGERFCRIALSQIRKNAKIQAALSSEQGKLSFCSAIMKCAEMGIEPDGRRAHLIPYKNEITLIIDYKGIAEMVMRNPAVSNIHADKVCDNDVFEYDRGEVKKHSIDFREDRGKAYAYYCIIRFANGSEKSEVMSRKEVDAIRNQSKAHDSIPWTHHFDEMGKKTVFRRASKWVPLSSEERAAIEADDDQYEPPRKVSPFEVPSIEAKAEAVTTDNDTPKSTPMNAGDAADVEVLKGMVSNHPAGITNDELNAYMRKHHGLGLTLSVYSVPNICKIALDCFEKIADEIAEGRNL